MRKAWLILLLPVAGLSIWLFAPALLGTASFAFRDAAHFYHPLFQYVRNEWGAGRVPLWNPYENLGIPLVAENTSSVFYPGKLLFALPADYTWLYNLYIIGHVMLAALTSFLFARHLRASTLGAAVGALSYAFAGNLLFQYCNVIFLVGAAWLPLALVYADRMLRLREVWACAGFGVVVALIVLGGDPQLAYNIGLASAGYALLLWWNERRARRGKAPSSRVPWRLLYLGGGSLLAGLLAAIQVLPSAAASPYGDRSHYDQPRNVYEYAQQCFEHGPGSTSLAAIWDDSSSGHHGHIYAFSVAPWRIVELLWPNATGRPFPSNRRLLSAFNAESNVWSPSLYLGLLPLVLAVRCFSIRRSAPVEIRWLSWMVVLSAVGSLGSFGIGHLLKQIVGDELNVGPEVGGLYWLMVTLLPGYVQFRYPQKLLVLAGVALSMLAARGWRGAWVRPGMLPRWFVAIGAASLIVLGAAAYGWSTLYQLRTSEVPNRFQGPFDWAGAWNDLLDGTLHTAILACALAVVFWLAGREFRLRRALQFAALAMLVIDLGAAQKCLIELAPAELWSFPTKFQAWFPDFRGRVFQQPDLLPPSFETSFIADRYAQAIAFDREVLTPKYPLADRIRLMEVPESVAGADFAEVIAAAFRRSERSAESNIPSSSVLDLLGVQIAIVSSPEDANLQDARPIVDGAMLAERHGALPRAWIVHQVDVHQEFRGRAPRAMRDFTYELLFPGGKPRDWKQEAVVETSDAVLLPTASAASVPEGERCTIEYDDPLRVEILARLTAPGLVVLSDQYFPGWELTVETAGVAHAQPILRTNRVMRGAVLPPGEHRLVYRYRPKSFYAGCAISLVTLTAVGLAAGLRMRFRSKSITGSTT